MNERNAEAVIPITISGRLVNFKVSVPMRDLGVHQAMPIFHALCDAVVNVAQESVVESGKRVSCCAGCGACCRQLVPVSRSEMIYLRHCLETLPSGRQDALKRRFTDAQLRLESAGMLDPLRNGHAISDREERRELGMRYFRLGISCPFLENGSCSIYPWRPMACREYLVTSPASACASPSPATIEMVPLPATPSKVMYRFDDGIGSGNLVWQPLILLHDSSHSESLSLLPGPRLIENFLQRLTGVFQG